MDSDGGPERVGCSCDEDEVPLLLLPTELGDLASGESPRLMTALFPVPWVPSLNGKVDFCNTSGLCTALRAARTRPWSMLLSDAALRPMADVLGHLLLATRPCKLRPGSQTAGTDGDMEVDNAPSVL